MRKITSGFTIVELLIVIVVIAILAAIMVVAYNGMQARAQLSTAQSDLASLMKKTELFMVDDGAPPNSAADWGSVLRAANLFEGTRDNNVKSFMFCWDSSTYTIIAATPIGYSPIFWYAKSGSVRSATYDSSITGTYAIDRACSQPAALPSNTGRVWAHSAS